MMLSLSLSSNCFLPLPHGTSNAVVSICPVGSLGSFLQTSSVRRGVNGEQVQKAFSWASAILFFPFASCFVRIGSGEFFFSFSFGLLVPNSFTPCLIWLDVVFSRFSLPFASARQGCGKFNGIFFHAWSWSTRTSQPYFFPSSALSVAFRFPPFFEMWNGGSTRCYVHWCQMASQLHLFRRTLSCLPHLLQWMARSPTLILSCMALVSCFSLHLVQAITLLG